MVGSARMNQLAIKLCPPAPLPMLKEDMTLEFNFFQYNVYEKFTLKKDLDK
jgi:hypothetical protein